MPASTSTPTSATSLETAVNDTDPNRELATQQAAGLRALADMIEANPELAEDMRYSNFARSNVPLLGGDATPARLAEFVRAAKAQGATVQKDANDKHFGVTLSWGPIGLYVYADRDQVCERVVTGTETVTRKVPDPNVDVPLVEVTETVEKVEWVCKPLLASEAVSR